MNRQTLTGLAFLALVLHFTIAGGLTNPNALVASGGDPTPLCTGSSEELTCPDRPGHTCETKYTHYAASETKTRTSGGSVYGCEQGKLAKCLGKDYFPADTGCKDPNP